MSHRGYEWQTYTPTWGSTGGTPSIGNGTLTGRYLWLGELVQVHVYMLFGSTSNGGSGDYTWTLPVTPDGVATFYASEYQSEFPRHGVGVYASGTVKFWNNNTTRWDQAQPSTDPFATGDQIIIWGSYKATP